MAKSKTTTPPEPYRPRTTVPSGTPLPVRYKSTPANDATLAAAARRSLLAEIFFGKDQS